MTKVIVIGSAGFLGKYICKELQENGYDVITFDKKDNPNQDTLTFNDDVSKLYDMDKADVVVNLAALVGLKHCLDNPINAVQQNLLGFTRILEYYKNRKVKIIHASTWAVNGNLINPYDITKLACEHMFMSYIKRGLVKGCILRFGTAYGLGMSEHGVIPSMITKMKNNEPLIIFGRGEQIRQFTHAKDVAKGVIAAIKNGVNGEKYYCVSEEIVTIKQLAETLSPNIEHLEQREADEKYVPLDNTSMKSLGWVQTVSFEEGMKEMKDYYNEKFRK